MFARSSFLKFRNSRLLTAFKESVNQCATETTPISFRLFSIVSCNSLDNRQAHGNGETEPFAQYEIPLQSTSFPCLTSNLTETLSINSQQYDRPPFDQIESLFKAEFDCLKNPELAQNICYLFSLAIINDKNNLDLGKYLQLMVNMKVILKTLSPNAQNIMYSKMNHILENTSNIGRADFVKTLASIELPWESLSTQSQAALIDNFITAFKTVRGRDSAHFAKSFQSLTQLGWKMSQIEATRRNVLFQSIKARLLMIIAGDGNSKDVNHSHVLAIVDSLSRVVNTLSECPVDIQQALQKISAAAITHSNGKNDSNTLNELINKLRVFDTANVLKLHAASTATATATASMNMSPHGTLYGTPFVLDSRTDAEILQSAQLNDLESRLVHSFIAARDHTNRNQFTKWLKGFQSSDASSHVHSLIGQLLASSAVKDITNSATYYFHRIKTLNLTGPSLLCSPVFIDGMSKLLSLVRLERNLGRTELQEYLKGLHTSGLRWNQLTDEHRGFVTKHIGEKIQRNVVENKGDAHFGLYIIRMVESMAAIEMPLSALSTENQNTLLDMLTRACNAQPTAKRARELISALNSMSALHLNYFMLTDKQRIEFVHSVLALLRSVSSEENKAELVMSVCESLLKITAGTELDLSKLLVQEGHSEHSDILQSFENMLNIRERTDEQIIGSLNLKAEQMSIVNGFLQEFKISSSDPHKLHCWLNKHQQSSVIQELQPLLESLLLAKNKEGVSCPLETTLTYFLYQLKQTKNHQQQQQQTSHAVDRSACLRKIFAHLSAIGEDGLSQNEFHRLLRGLAASDVHFGELSADDQQVFAHHLHAAVKSDALGVNLTDLLISLVKLKVHWSDLRGDIRTAILQSASPLEDRALPHLSHQTMMLTRLGVDLTALQPEEKQSVYNMALHSLNHAATDTAALNIKVVSRTLGSLTRMSAVYEDCPAALQSSVAASALKITMKKYNKTAADVLPVQLRAPLTEPVLAPHVINPIASLLSGISERMQTQMGVLNPPSVLLSSASGDSIDPAKSPKNEEGSELGDQLLSLGHNVRQVAQNDTLISLPSKEKKAVHTVNTKNAVECATCGSTASKPDVDLNENMTVEAEAEVTTAVKVKSVLPLTIPTSPSVVVPAATTTTSVEQVVKDCLSQTIGAPLVEIKLTNTQVSLTPSVSSSNNSESKMNKRTNVIPPQVPSAMVTTSATLGSSGSSKYAEFLYTLQRRNVIANSNRRELQDDGLHLMQLQL